MSIELKPCPFCGGEAEMMGDQYPYVECHECGAGFTANHSYEFDEDDAASNWNTRRFGQDKMKRIAEKKIEQLGGDVCGVLVRKDGRLAAVDEHGRVRWLQDDGGEYAAYLEGMNSHLKAELEAARAQSGQGAEPLAYWDGDAGEAETAFQFERDSIYSTPVYTQPQPAQQGSVPDAKAIIAALRTCSSITEAEAVVMAQMNLSKPQPEADGWVKCSERLPTEADADVDENVWVYDKAMSNEKYRQTRAIWWTVKEVSDYTHWKPTGLKRPQPPKEGE